MAEPWTRPRVALLEMRLEIHITTPTKAKAAMSACDATRWSRNERFMAGFLSASVAKRGRSDWCVDPLDEDVDMLRRFDGKRLARAEPAHQRQDRAAQQEGGDPGDQDDRPAAHRRDDVLLRRHRHDDGDV